MGLRKLSSKAQGPGGISSIKKALSRIFLLDSFKLIYQILVDFQAEGSR